jgi:lipoprotein-anchoring transpeptidase ErfK/SrfK
MRRLLILALSAALAGCASTAVPPGTQADAARLAQSVVPGRTTKAEMLAQFGPTKHVVFESGYEAWVYQSPAGGKRFAEFVILIDPSGVVKKTRQGAPALP